ncbi:hypothetical protein HK102_013495, partial [Quaeritorhiza haematococci]
QDLQLVAINPVLIPRSRTSCRNIFELQHKPAALLSSALLSVQTSTSTPTTENSNSINLEETNDESIGEFVETDGREPDPTCTSTTHSRTSTSDISGSDVGAESTKSELDLGSISGSNRIDSSNEEPIFSESARVAGAKLDTAKPPASPPASGNNSSCGERSACLPIMVAASPYAPVMEKKHGPIPSSNPCSLLNNNSSRARSTNECKALYIGRLPDTVTTWRLRRAVCLYGNIVEVDHDLEGGEALVAMATPEEATALRNQPGPDGATLVIEISPANSLRAEGQASIKDLSGSAAPAAEKDATPTNASASRVRPKLSRQIQDKFILKYLQGDPLRRRSS